MKDTSPGKSILKYFKNLFKPKVVHQFVVGDIIHYKNYDEDYTGQVIGIIDKSILIIEYNLNGKTITRTIDSADIVEAN